MGNWPSISRVVRTIAPAWKTAWLVSSETVDLLDALRREDAAQLAQRPGRDVGLELAAELALELGPLDREPVGVGRDHRHLRAAGGDEDAGQHRPHVVARGGAGDQVDGSRQRLRRDLQPGSLVRLREASGSPRRAGCAGGSWSCRCGSRRRARPRAARSPPSRRPASARPRPAAGPAAGPSPRSSTSASSVVSKPIRDRWRESVTPSVGGGERGCRRAPGSRRGSKRPWRRSRAWRRVLRVWS